MYSEKSKLVICLDSFLIFLLGNVSTCISLWDDCLVKFANLQCFPLASFARSYRVTDEAFIAET